MMAVVGSLAGKTIVALGFETAQADAEHRARVAQQEQQLAQQQQSLMNQAHQIGRAHV